LFYLWPAAEFARVRGNSAVGWAYNASTYVGMCVEWKNFYYEVQRILFLSTRNM